MEERLFPESCRKIYKERLDLAEDVVVAEAIGTAVLSIATNPYGRYIWKKGRGGAGTAVRRVNPDRPD